MNDQQHQAGSGPVLYHAARASARAAIARDGLRAFDPGTSGNPAAVYGFVERERTAWHAGWYPAERFDCWAVDVAGLPVVVDATHEALGGRAVLADVPPERLRYLGPVTA